MSLYPFHSFSSCNRRSITSHVRNNFSICVLGSIFFPSLAQKFLICSQFFLFRDAFPLTIKEVYQSTNISTNNKTNSTLCSLKLTISSLTVIIRVIYTPWPSLVDSVGKNLPTFQCRWYRFTPWLGRSSGEENGTPLSILAWEITWIEEPDELQSMGLQRVK